MDVPSAFVIMDEDELGESPGGQVTDVTLSPYEAQDLLDSGFSLVEPVPIPPVIVSWAQQFVNHHFKEEPFKKRKGIGSALSRLMTGLEIRGLVR